MPSAPDLNVRDVIRTLPLPLFVRRISRPALWQQALDAQDPACVSDYLFEEAGTVSLWQVSNDTDLRRVAIAINESRQSLREQIDLLPILPAELETAGVAFIQTAGETSCPPAARLHYDASIDEEKGKMLLSTLLANRRTLSRCTRGQMSKAEAAAIKDGCFAASEGSIACNCGENRQI